MLSVSADSSWVTGHPEVEPGRSRDLGDNGTTAVDRKIVANFADEGIFEILVLLRQRIDAGMNRYCGIGNWRAKDCDEKMAAS